jgi:serine/threonine protein kinase
MRLVHVAVIARRPFLIGEILGNRYKLLRELGAGGMAWVYLAEDLLDNTQVAVKVLYTQFSQDMSYVQRFVREAKLARQITNEHVVHILNYGADRDVHYLVMEMIQGKELSTILRERGRLPWDEALRIAAQVVRALDAANQHGVVHRDIKPQNIMITRQGVVKVLDFGIARARALPSLTQTGFVGSPYYISPEQAMGEDVDIRSDIYSLGVALYEMLSGKLPFDAPSPWSIISQHIAQEPPTLALENSGFPPHLEDLVNRMLAKDPEDRYQTPSHLLAAIDSLLEGRGESAAALFDPGTDETVVQSKAHRLLLSSLYERAVEAADESEWHQAVNLFNRILKIDPHYQDVAERLATVGRQARVAALYSAAQDALQEERLQEAIDELSEIVSVDPDYRDAAELLTQAGMSLAEAKTRARVASLYEKGLMHYRKHEWQQAEYCFTQVFESAPHYRDIAELHPKASRRALWSGSLLGRIGQRLVGWITAPGADNASGPAKEGE